MIEGATSFRAGYALPLLIVGLIVAVVPSFVASDPSVQGLFVFRWLAQPEMKPLRILIAAICILMAASCVLHLMRRFLGQAMLEVRPDSIVFQGLFRREISVDQIERIDDFYGSMLVKLKVGRSVRIPVLLLSDFYGAKRALERVGEQVAMRSPAPEA